MKAEPAKALATQALVWLADDPERMGAFLGATGANPSSIRAEAGDPAFLAAVLDFLLMSDENVLGFAADHAIKPEDVQRARAALPGADVPNWT